MKKGRRQSVVRNLERMIIQRNKITPVIRAAQERFWGERDSITVQAVKIKKNIQKYRPFAVGKSGGIIPEF